MDDKIEIAYTVDMNEGTNALEMFNNVCRVCLQDGELLSLYDKTGESEFTHAEKIMQVVTSVNLKKKEINLPQQICAGCVNDLETSYRFIKNCESSDAILQTYTIPNSLTNEDELEEDEEDEEEDEEEEEQEEEIEQELPVNDFYITCKYKPEIYDTEIIVENEKNALVDKEIEVEAEIVKPVTKSKRESAKDKANRSKRSSSNSQANEKEQEKIHICEICANQYKYRHALEVHMRRHRGDKPFKCEFCNRSFVIRFELKRHMRVHTGQKPYNCRFCERKFSDFGSRIKHERSHTGERPYVCQTCGKTFAYSHVLSGHLLTHTGEKRHQCLQCGKRFTKSHHLKSHLNTHLKALNKQTSAMVQNVTREPTSIANQEQIKQEQEQQQPIQTTEQELMNVVYM